MCTPTKVDGVHALSLSSSPSTSDDDSNSDGIIRQEENYISARTPRSRMRWPITPLQIALRLQSQKLVDSFAPDRCKIFDDNATFVEALNGDVGILKEVVKAGMNRQLSFKGPKILYARSKSLSASRPKSRNSYEVDVRRPQSQGFQRRSPRWIKQKSVDGGMVRQKSFPASRQGSRNGCRKSPSRFQLLEPLTIPQAGRRVEPIPDHIPATSELWSRHSGNEMTRPNSSMSYLRSNSFVMKQVDQGSQNARKRLKRRLKAKQERFERSMKRVIKNRTQQQKIKREKEETRKRNMISRSSSTKSIPLPIADRPLKRVRTETQEGWLAKKKIWSASVDQNKQRLQKVQLEKERLMDIKWKLRQKKSYSRFPKKKADKLMGCWPSSPQKLKIKPSLTFFQRVTNTFEFNYLIPALVEGRRKKWHPGVVEALETNVGISRITRKTTKTAVCSAANKIEDVVSE